MSSSTREQWCVLRQPKRVHGEFFEAGRPLRVAGRFLRAGQETVTLDGNQDEDNWTTRRVLHQVPVSDIHFTEPPACREA